MILYVPRFYFIDAHALRSHCSLPRRTAVRFAVIGKIQPILFNGTDKTPSFNEIYNVVKVLPIIISRWCNRSWKI